MSETPPELTPARYYEAPTRKTRLSFASVTLYPSGWERHDWLRELQPDADGHRWKELGATDSGYFDLPAPPETVSGENVFVSQCILCSTVRVEPARDGRPRREGMTVFHYFGPDRMHTWYQRPCPGAAAVEQPRHRWWRLGR